MSHHLVMLTSALGKFRRVSLVGSAALCVAIICLLPLLGGTAYFLIGRQPWSGAAAGPPLAGYTDKAPSLQFNWWNRVFQTTVASRISERLPLRNWMIRFNNELDYQILAVSRMYGGYIIIGKNGVLFETPYITRALGYAPVMPDGPIRRLVGRIKYLGQLLRQRGIPLLVIGSPGKVSFMRNAVPISFREYHPESPRNYDNLVRIFAETGVPFVDGRAEMRKSGLAIRGPFFPKGGTHWTLLGAYAALEHPIARLLSEIDPTSRTRIVLDDVTISPQANGTDSDLLDLANLLFPDRRYGTTTVKLHLEGSPLPRAIVLVGTSFTYHLQAILSQSRIAPTVLRFPYMRWDVPANWPQIILNETSAVILEINEGGSYTAAGGYGYSDYIDTLLDGLIPILERP